MKAPLFAVLLLFGACLVGCEPSKPAVKPEDKPVVDIKKDSDGKPDVKVDAPGVKVNINEKEGVEIKTPGVEVDTKPEN